MRPYQWDKRMRSYAVKDAGGNTVHRRTRTAAGMTATNGRSGRWARKDDVRTLCVRGTLAKISGLHFRVTNTSRGKCHCCGQVVRKLALNNSGRLHLRYMRRRYCERLNQRLNPWYIGNIHP